MSCKDQKLNIRRNLEQIKGMVKARHMNLQKDKENMIDYFRKDKSRSGNKNPATPLQPKPAPPKKSHSHHDDQYNSKKLRTQAADLLLRTNPMNLTMNPKNQLKKPDSSNYFLTADVSSVLKVINKNMNGSLQKRRVNMMTEEDIERLFEREPKKSESRNKGRRQDMEETMMTGKIRCEEKSKSKSREKRKAFMQTDPDLEMGYQRKIETMKLNLKGMMDEEDKEDNNLKKDFAESIKFLEITEDSTDKLLSALKDEGLVKVEADPTVDKTTKFKEEFVVGKQIGEGAYASVRVAIYKPNNKKVAIKIYEKKKIKEIQRRKSVRRQIKILQKIDHRNILKIYDVIQTNNHVNIIMQYIPGISLNTYLKSQSNSKASEKDARRIFTPLVQAITYLHQHCICHRDIKLQNILLDSRLNPKLIDFGFSTCIQQQKKVKMFCGTPSYMAPEIVVKKEYRGSLADVWALGVLLYVILTGVFPFKGQTDKELYQKICAADYPKMVGVSKSVENLIQGMLTVDPDRRITAEEILKHEWITNVMTVRQQRPLQNELHNKFENLLNMTKYRKTQQVTSSRQKHGLAQTYKQNLLKYQLNKLNQPDKQPSPRLAKPRTCTNRQSYRINFQQPQPRQLQKSSSKLLQLLKMQLRRKDQSPDAKLSTQPTITAPEQKLTNKRYF